MMEPPLLSRFGKLCHIRSVSLRNGLGLGERSKSVPTRKHPSRRLVRIIMFDVTKIELRAEREEDKSLSPRPMHNIFIREPEPQHGGDAGPFSLKKARLGEVPRVQCCVMIHFNSSRD